MVVCGGQPPVIIAFGTVNYIVLGVYLAAMVGIGLLFARRQSTTEEYFLAGRRMPWLVVGMSMFASLTSASTYLGVPAFAYKNNISIFFGVLVSPIVAPILVLVFYRFYRRMNVTTSYEYILARFGKEARYTVSALFVLSRVAWLGVVIYGPALAFSVATGMDLWAAICMMGVLATVYTTLGGLAAVLWTDAVQFVILVAGAVWVAVSLVGNVPGGVSEIVSVGASAGRLDVFFPAFDLYKMTAAAAGFSWFFVFMYDYGADQITVQRLMATRDFRSTTKAVVFNSFSDCIINGLLLFIGLGLWAYFQAYPDRLDAGLAADSILPFYIMDALPAGVSGMIITAVFAAAMSSMDSGLNSISTVIVSDFVRPLRKINSGDKGDVALARYITAGLGVFATGAAFGAAQIGSIVKAWSSFMSLFSGPVLAIFLLGIFFKRASFTGWLAGCIVSIGATFYVQYYTDVHWVYYMPFSFGVSFVIGLVAGLAPSGIKGRK